MSEVRLATAAAVSMIVGIAMVMVVGHRPVPVDALWPVDPTSREEERAQNRQDQFVGVVVGRQEADLSFPTEGQAVYVIDIGSSVEAGDVVARVDEALQRARLHGAEASFHAARSRLQAATAEWRQSRDLTRRLHPLSDEVVAGRERAEAEFQEAIAQSRLLGPLVSWRPWVGWFPPSWRCNS